MKSYVDWFEQRGIRVIPIPYTTTDVDAYFSIINGLFIPGGNMPYIMQQPTFMKTVARFFELSLQAGEYFPIWGTCFGFELLMFLVGGFTNLLEYDAHGYYPISITNPSRMCSGFSKRYLNYLENSKSTMQNHFYGISPEDFLKNPHLRRFFSIVATSLDNAGKTYVTAIEGKFYPVYGVQFHPERQRTTGPFLDFLVAELGKNRHKTPGGLPHIATYRPRILCKEYREVKKVACYAFE